MTTLTITLPDDLAKIAKAKGLLSAIAFEEYVREKIREDAESEKHPPGFDPRLRDAAAPELVGTAHCRGDIVAPLDIKWEAMP